MSKSSYRQFVSRWKETMDLPPQTVGPLTGLYKRMTHQLKIMPMPTLLFVSAVLVILLIVLLGPSIAPVVTLLQRGF